jgi:hypothetical protein
MSFDRCVYRSGSCTYFSSLSSGHFGFDVALLLDIVLAVSFGLQGFVGALGHRT